MSSIDERARELAARIWLDLVEGPKRAFYEQHILAALRAERLRALVEAAGVLKKEAKSMRIDAEFERGIDVAATLHRADELDRYAMRIRTLKEAP